MPRRRLVPALILVIPFLLPLAIPRIAAAEPIHLSLTGGIHSPLGEDERDDFGIAPQFGIGIATEFADGASMLGLDFGYVRSGGEEGSNPTFDLPESHYTLVPITMSVTTRLADDSKNPWPKIYIGFFATVMPTSYTDANGDSESTPTVGAGLELRPEFRLGERGRGLARTRLQLVDTIDYGDLGSDYNSSALSLELGVSTELR